MVSSYMGLYLLISSYILGSPFSYMTLQLLHSEFPYRWGKFNFLFLSVYTVALTFSEKCGGDEAGHADEGSCASRLLSKEH